MPIPAKGKSSRGPAGKFQSPGPAAPPESPPPDAPEPEAVPNQEIAAQLPQTRFDPEFHSIEARVVYLGGNPNKSVYYPGTVLLQEHPESGEPVWMPNAEGGTDYDFRRYDARGRVIKARLTQDGKVWGLCRHIGHLVRFMGDVDEDGPQFEVRAVPAVVQKIERFARLQLERQRRNTESGPTLLTQMGLGGG